MKLKYSLTIDDFLAHALFQASEKESIKSRRNKARILFPIIMCISALFAFFILSYPFLELIYISCGILWFVFYPKYSAKRYKKIYIKSLKESYGERIGMLSTLELKQDHLFGISIIGESKIYLNQINRIAEISTHFLIRLNTGNTLIIPKDRELEEGNAEEFVNSLSKIIDLEVIDRLNWQWK